MYKKKATVHILSATLILGVMFVGDTLGQLRLGPATPVFGIDDLEIGGAYTFSPDLLEIYFEVIPIDRSELWIAKRDSLDKPFGEAERAPSIISNLTEFWVGGADVTADGLGLYLRAGSTIYRVSRDSIDGDWSHVDRLGPEVNKSGYWHEAVTISADELDLVFQRRPAWSNFEESTDIYHAARHDRESSDWEVQRLPFASDGEFEGLPTLSPGGLNIFFTKPFDEDIEGQSWLWVSQRTSKSDPWSQPFNLGLPEGDWEAIWQSEVSVDGDTLYFYGIESDADSVTRLYSAPILNLNPGDADRNGQVDFADFLLLSPNFGGPGQWQHGDFTSDGIVGFADFLLLSRYFKGSTDFAPVPEPSEWQLNIALATLGIFACVSRSRAREN